MYKYVIKAYNTRDNGRVVLSTAEVGIKVKASNVDIAIDKVEDIIIRDNYEIIGIEEL